MLLSILLTIDTYKKKKRNGFQTFTCVFSHDCTNPSKFHGFANRIHGDEAGITQFVNPCE